jgi:pseudaminic acid synthase
METINIGNSKIAKGQPTMIIAELSCNHLQNFDIAVKTIEEMKKAGVDCVKLQTVKPESITIDSRKKDFIIKGGTLWDGKSLYELYSQTYTPWEWHEPLKILTEKLGMIFFSSPFDNDAVDFLDKLGVPAYKIASFEITDIPLIKYTAAKQKPIIISTGIAREEDIRDAVDACREVGNNQIILLKCTSAYPTPFKEINLNVISTIRNKFNCQVGLSDHTLGELVPLGAVALGAVIVEKHFILERSMGGPDSEFSMEPTEFKKMIDSIRSLELALGSNEIKLSPIVEKNRQFARSLYVVEDIDKDQNFSLKNVRSIRPSHGLPPKFLYQIIGKKAKWKIEKGTPLSWEMFN